MCAFARDQLLKWMQIKRNDFCDNEGAVVEPLYPDPYEGAGRLSEFHFA